MNVQDVNIQNLGIQDSDIQELGVQAVNLQALNTQALNAQELGIENLEVQSANVQDLQAQDLEMPTLDSQASDQNLELDPNPIAAETSAAAEHFQTGLSSPALDRGDSNSPPPTQTIPLKKLKADQRANRRRTRKKTVLIPFVEEIVPVVDFDRKRIEINPPKGLID